DREQAVHRGDDRDADRRRSTCPTRPTCLACVLRAMNIGIIGSGNISGTHARAASAIPGVAVAAVYGRNADRVATLAGRHGAAAYTEFDRFLRHRPMEVVA